MVVGGAMENMELKPDIMSLQKMKEILDRKGIFLLDSSSLNNVAFKSFFQTYFSEIRNADREQFLVPEFERNSVNDTMKTAVQMVIDRGFFSVFDNMGDQDYTILLEQLCQYGIKKLNVVVNDSKKKNVIFSAAKKAEIYVYFYAINTEGKLESFANKTIDIKSNYKMMNMDRSIPYKNGGATKTDNNCFQIKDVPEKLPYKQITVRTLLCQKMYVVDSSGEKYCLEKEEMSNNNSHTYSSDHRDIWIKIFEPSSLNTYLEAKIKMMLSKEIRYPGLCWPIDIVTDETGTFRGYLMPKAEGKSLLLTVFKKAGIENNFSGWTRLDLCDLTLSILKIIEYMHERNILFGCINPAAIRVVDKQMVYFVDTDNYQIEGFPTTVYNISFKAPELIDKKMYLATKANENFSVASLVFMIMMPGKSPYAIGNNSNPMKSIRNMKYQYDNGVGQYSYSVPGIWRFMYSHLLSLRGAFYNVFQKNAKYNAPQSRKNVVYWINAVKYYRKDIEESFDPETKKIYPRNFRREKGVNFYRCSACSTEYPRFYFVGKYFDTERICYGCYDKKSNVSFTCKACGKTYYYTNRTALFHKTQKMLDSEWKDQKYCRDCKKKTITCIDCGKEYPFYYMKNGRCPDCNAAYKMITFRTIRCKECGCYFNFTNGDHEFYQSKGFSDPVKCPSCRSKKRF